MRLISKILFVLSVIIAIGQRASNELPSAIIGVVIFGFLFCFFEWRASNNVETEKAPD